MYWKHDTWRKLVFKYYILREIKNDNSIPTRSTNIFYLHVHRSNYVINAPIKYRMIKLANYYHIDLFNFNIFKSFCNHFYNLFMWTILFYILFLDFIINNNFFIYVSTEPLCYNNFILFV